MSETNKARRMLVIGGGIGGLAAALALARQGIRVQLLEQAPEIPSAAAPDARPADFMEALGHGGPRSRGTLERGARHRARRRGAPNDSVPRAGCLSGA